MTELNRLPVVDQSNFTFHAKPIFLLVNTFALIAFNYLVAIPFLRAIVAALLMALTCLEAHYWGVSVSTERLATGRTGLLVHVLLFFVLGSTFFSATILVQAPFSQQPVLMIGLLSLFAGAVSFCQGKWLGSTIQEPT